MGTTLSSGDAQCIDYKGNTSNAVQRRLLTNLFDGLSPSFFPFLFSNFSVLTGVFALSTYVLMEASNTVACEGSKVEAIM